MFRTYDDWKLATPPEYEESGPDSEEGEDEPQEPTPSEEFWNDPCWQEPAGPLG